MRFWVLLHVAVFAVALVIRLALTEVFVGLSAPPKGEANPDQVDYELLAYNVIHSNEYALEPGTPSACRPPGTPFILLPVYAIFGRSFLAARLWFCLLSAACCPVVGWIGHRLAGPLTGLLAATWLAVYPGHAYFAVHFLSETPITLVTALAVAFHVEGLRRPSGWPDVAAGLAWGFGILVRPNLAVAAGLAVLITLAARTVAGRARVRKAAVVSAAAALVVVPWVARNAAVMGKPAVCTIVGGYTFWGAYNPNVADDPNKLGGWVSATSMLDAEHPLTGGEVEREATAYRYGWAFIRARPERLPAMKLHALLRTVWAYHEVGNEKADLAFRVGWIASLPFVVVGLVSLARRVPLETLHLLTPVAAVLVTAMMFYGCSRFRDGAAPVWAVFAAAGVTAAWSRFFGGRARPKSRVESNGGGAEHR
jgi:hypothetical protein